MSPLMRARAEWVLRLVAFALPLLSLAYLVRFRVAGLPSTLLEVLIWVFVIASVVVMREAGRARAQAVLRPWRWPIVAWIIATLIAVVASPSLWTGLGLWRAYVLEPLLVLVALCMVLRQPGDRRRMEQGLMLASCVVSVWAIVGYLGNWGIPHPWNVTIAAGRRAVGPFGFPNAVALFIAPILALTFARLMKDGTDRAVSVVTLLLGALAIVAAKSDGGMLAVACVVMLALLGNRIGRRVVALGAVAGGVGLALLPTLRAQLVQEITFQGWSGKVRLIMWRETWSMLKDHWFFGAGFGGYPKIFDAYHKARFIEIFQYPHTLLFNFWTETGLLGIAAFVSIVVTWIKDAARTVKAKALTLSVERYCATLVLLAPLIAILVHGLVDVIYFKNDLALLFWIFVWLVLAGKQESLELA